MKEALLIFSKNPEPGKVKTRLAATMGNEAALAVYRQMLRHTVAITRDLAVDKFVFYSSYIEQNDGWEGNRYHKVMQQGNDLGERMKNAFALTFRNGFDSSVIIGTDCPGLNAGIIDDAFSVLKSFDVVIGPAEDGGYYLLGMRQLHPQLFDGIEWSTSSVLSDTIGKCVAAQLSYYLLAQLKDVDEEKDLDAFELKYE